MSFDLCENCFDHLPLIMIFFFLVCAFDSNDPRRLNTEVRKFALKYNLGQPKAGNFFYASFDQRTNKTLTEYGPFQPFITEAFERAAREREKNANRPIYKW